MIAAQTFVTNTHIVDTVRSLAVVTKHKVLNLALLPSSRKSVKAPLYGDGYTST